MDFQEVYKSGNLEVRFEESEQEMLYCLKDREPYFLTYFISVHEDGKVISRYFKRFDKHVHANERNRFIRKFLEEPTFRSSMLVDGSVPWEGIIPFAVDYGGRRLNESCQKAITKLMKQKHPKFKDFASLKTYGTDGFSRLKLSQMAEIIPQETIERFVTVFDGETHALTAMRWHLRGLSIDYAIRKVKTDLEIRANMVG
jgi:hypothetical protein